MAEEEKPNQAAKRRLYTMNDLHDPKKNVDNYSAFGTMQLSPIPTEPVINFGRETRDKRAKVYQSKENMKAFLGIPLLTRQKLSGDVPGNGQVCI